MLLSERLNHAHCILDPGGCLRGACRCLGMWRQQQQLCAAKHLGPARPADAEVDPGSLRQPSRHRWRPQALPGGTGSPTVILESGYHDSSQPWSLNDGFPPAVLPGVAGFTKICAYDRPGTLLYTDPPRITDRSSPVRMPRTAQDVTSDLHALLGAAEVPGPYILVAHSLGGLFVRLYAQTYPDQVRGLVLVDAFPRNCRHCLDRNGRHTGRC